MASDVTYSPTSTPHIAGGHNGQTENLLSSTTKMLDSLISFYQQERMWIYRMRAQEACSPQLKDESPEQAQPDSTSMGTSAEQHEYHFVDQSSNGQTTRTRWMRRKREFKLRLEGIRSKRVHPLQIVQGQPAEELRPREQMLEMFEKMMEARMESCQRVNKLVQEASRANTHQASTTQGVSSTVAEVDMCSELGVGLFVIYALSPMLI